MKKFLLFATAAVIAVSANAQNVISKKSISSAKIEKQTVKHQMHSAKEINGKALIMGKEKKNQINAFSQIKNLKGLNLSNCKKIKKTSKRTSELAQSYDASATNYRNQETENWTMLTSTLTDGTPCFVDVIPNFFNDGEGLAAKYSIDASGKITIPAQKVAELTVKNNDGSDLPLYAYLVNPLTSSADGSMHMTLSSDGSLTSTEGYIAYYLFMSDEFKFKKEDGSTNVYTSFIYSNIAYAPAGAAPVTMFDINNAILFACQSISGNYWKTNMAITGADAPVSLVNKSTGKATSWAWSVDENETTLTSTDKDYQFIAGRDKEYTNLTLTGYNGDNSKTFTFGLGNALDSQNEPMYDAFELDGGGSENIFQFSSNGTHSIMSRFNPDGDLAYYSGNFGTPDLAGEDNSFHKIISYQGKPSSPLYITGITLPLILKSFNDDFHLDVKIYKAVIDKNGDKVLGDHPIATSTATKDNIDETYKNQSGLSAISFPLSIENEDGLSTDVDYLFIDDAFFIVIEGWDNGTFSAVLGAQDFTDHQDKTTWFTLTGDQKEDWYSWTGWNTALFIGLDGASYGYLATADNTNINIPNEGGKVSINVEPMLIYNDDNGQPTTGIWLDENIEGNEIPEWLEVGIIDHYSVDGEGNLTEANFDLVFQADALPEGTEGRKATLVFFQPGAQLEVTVTQGTVAGIEVTTKTVKTSNAAMFNLAGQRVDKNYKGIVIKNGNKFIVK